MWEEVLGLNRARHLEITQGSFTAQQALSWGAVAEVVPLGQVLLRAQELAEQMTQRPHLTNKYIAVVFRQRISRRLAEGTMAGIALEGLTAANLAYPSAGSGQPVVTSPGERSALEHEPAGAELPGGGQRRCAREAPRL